MYSEPWSDISEYPEGHKEALQRELLIELNGEHVLIGKDLKILV